MACASSRRCWLGWRVLVAAFALLWHSGSPLLQAEEKPAAEKALLGDAAARELAARVTIYRDRWGVGHVDGQDDAATMFGFAYVQCEDYFWQVEDNYILSLGRYAEAHGPRGLNSDLLNRAFRVVPNSQAAYKRIEPAMQRLCEAFVAGLNYYLATHPEVRPRLIERFEPWHVLAYGRHITLELCYRYAGISGGYIPRTHEPIYTSWGSNAWAIAGSRTRSGKPMLMVNPHLPWAGFTQLCEVHLRSGEGWNFIGGTTYGNPMPSMGHNEHLGWTFTTNEPNVADAWRIKFDVPDRPLAYRYGKEVREAVEWTEAIMVKSVAGAKIRKFTLRRTHHGPIVSKQNDGSYLAVRIAGIDDLLLLRQSSRMIRARNLNEFQTCLKLQQFPIMNITYADRAGNIFYIYNGLIPKRNLELDWTKSVDGSDPRSEWGAMHAVSELPQVTNPECGFLQNCNSTPFLTCDDSNPERSKFPIYMCDDAADDKRRGKRSREMLRGMRDIKLDDFERAAFDTKLWWAEHEMPEFEKDYLALQNTQPELANKVAPYWAHLKQWDRRVDAESTGASLAVEWYERVYGGGYPAEGMLPAMRRDPSKRFTALADAAAALQSQYGDWKIPWGKTHRSQRRSQVVDFYELPFDDSRPSLPLSGAPGPLGGVLTQYYSPTVRMPLFKSLQNRYGLLGATYLAIYEFGDRISGRSLVNYGASGNVKSSHFTDQAELLSERRMKPELFYWDDVQKQAATSYKPGAEMLNADSDVKTAPAPPPATAADDDR